MKRIVVMTLIAVFTFSGLAFASVVNFDATTGSLTNYEGFAWQNTTTGPYTGYNTNYSNALTPVSDNNFAYNDYGYSVTLTRADDFDFNSVYLTGWRKDDAVQIYTAETVTITGYNDGTLVQSFIADLSPVMSYFEVNFLGVDKLVFTPNGNSQQPTLNDQLMFLMDDFTYSNPPSVPEPSTILLLGGGLAGLAFYRRKKK